MGADKGEVSVGSRAPGFPPSPQQLGYELQVDEGSMSPGQLCQQRPKNTAKVEETAKSWEYVEVGEMLVDRHDRNYYSARHSTRDIIAVFWDA